MSKTNISCKKHFLFVSVCNLWLVDINLLVGGFLFRDKIVPMRAIEHKGENTQLIGVLNKYYLVILI